MRSKKLFKRYIDILTDFNTDKITYEELVLRITNLIGTKRRLRHIYDKWREDHA